MKITKVKIAISIDVINYNKLIESKINKSKLINWLLANYYNMIKDETNQ